ncbi:hypothetical protein BHE74_00025035 [Ensete ventricosum]|nr:hypothetical protein BHE74_00025035 [Ensete ventricosum]RZR82663.1 hypothetical protein BHM03_00009121 [Ensete ventricosum]
MGIHTSTISRENAMVINSAQSRVLIGFTCSISKIQKLAFPNILAHGKLYELGFVKKLDCHKLC